MNEGFNNKENTNEVNGVNNVENITSIDMNVVEQTYENIEDKNTNINKEKNNKTKKVLIVIIGIIVLLLIALTIYVVIDKKDNSSNSDKDNNIVENNKDDEDNNNVEEDTLIYNDNYIVNGKKYILYSKNDKMGLMDENKNIVIDAKYEGVYYLLNGVLGHSSYTIMYWKNDENGKPMFLAGRDNSYVLIKNTEEKVLYKEKDNLKNPYQIGKIGDYIVLHTADSVKVIDEKLNVIIENGIYSDIFTYSWNDNTVVAYDGNKTYEFDMNLKLKNTYDEKGKIAHKSGMGPTDVTSFSNYIIGVEKDYISEVELYYLNSLNYQIVTEEKDIVNLYKNNQNIVSYEYNIYELNEYLYRSNIIVLEHIGIDKKTLYDIEKEKEIFTCDNCKVELDNVNMKVLLSDNTELIYDSDGNKIN